MDYISSASSEADYGGSHSSPLSGNTLGFRQLADIVTRNFWAIVVITLVIFSTVLASTFLLRERYFSSAAVRLDPAAKAVGDSGSRSLTPQAEQARMDTEMQVMQSREMASRVVSQLHLANDAELLAIVAADESPAQRAHDRLIDAFLSRLSVQRNDDYVVRIGFASGDPEKAARVANAMARTYVERTVADRNRTAGEQARWLGDRLRSLGAEVQQDRARVAQLRAVSGIAGTALGGTVTDQQIGPLSMEMAQAEGQVATAQAELTAARAQIARGDIGAVSGVLDSPVIAELRRQRAQAGQSRAEIETRFGPRHPDYERVVRQTAELDSALQAEAQRIVAGLDNRLRLAQARANRLRSSLAGVRGEQSSNARSTAIADTLQQQAGAKQASYDDLARRLEQVLQDQRDIIPTASIIEQAVPPTRADFPNRPLFAALGLVLGLIGGLIVTFFRELTNLRIVTSEDLAKATRLPTIATMPVLGKKQLAQNGAMLSPEDYLVEKPMSAFAEAFRALRNEVIFSEVRPKVVSVVSSLPAEGKTTVAACLARIMAMSGDRVLLVDCDLRRGRLRQMASAPDYGLVEVLAADVPWRLAVVQDGTCPLHVLPCKAHTFIPQDILSGAGMTQLLDDVRREYDFIVLDTPPALAVADSRTIAALSDAAIFVARSNQTPSHAASLAIEQFGHDRTVMLGTVLTMVPERARRSRHDAYYYNRQCSAYVEA